MADPRFFRNEGPFNLAAVTAKLGLDLPAGSDGAAMIADLAGLDGAGPQHLSFYSGLREQKETFQASRAGFAWWPKTTPAPPLPAWWCWRSG